MLRGLQKLAPLLKYPFIVLAIPLGIVWKVLLRPLALLWYKAYLIFGDRLKTFFHAQHKLLAVVTHRMAIHVLVMVLTVGIVTANVLQAEEVRAEEFANGSIISKVFSPETDTTVTSAAIASAVPTSYIDSSASVKIIPSISGTAEIVTVDAVTVAGGGAAVVKSNVLGVDDSSRSDIQQYVVQPGDTASTIAAKFGVSTQTVLWSNDLRDASLIKPGDTLYILPTTGVAHTVKSGETIDSIAKKYGANADEVLEFNNLIDASDLAAGVEIIVPGGTQPAPPPPPTTRLASVRDVFSGGSAAPSAAPAASGSFNWPTITRRISQYFRYGHSGIDIDGEFGDAIYAADGGSVSTGWYGGYGLQVVINHGNGLQTRYAHMQKVFVSNGQSVSKGQSLGEMGSTGYSTGSHLHFEVITGGRTVNPFSYY